MKYISRAPFRAGLAGGGTDVSPFSDQFGGAILNATISLYSTVTIVPTNNGKISILATDSGESLEVDSEMVISGNENLKLQIGVYNGIVKRFAKKPLSFEMTTSMDVPSGSGLGTSSTLVVAIIGAFAEWLKLPLGEYDIARLAVEIEREDLKMAGGKQDQYAATFGGVNFMEFYEENRVIVNPLRINPHILKELEYHLLLFSTQTKRESSSIIEVQKSNFENKSEDVLEATKELKRQAYDMKEALLKGELHQIGEILRFGWEKKKRLARGISNSSIDKIYTTAIEAGASGGKISGAGGGGFMIFFCPNNSRYKVIEALKQIGVVHQNYTFQLNGLETWTSQL